MADSAGDQLLLDFGLNLAPLKQAADTVQQILDRLNSTSAELDAKATITAKNQQATNTAAKAAAEAAIAAAKLAVQQEQLKAASAKTTTEQLKNQEQAQRNITEASKSAAAAEAAKSAAIRTETEEANKLLATRKAETAELQRQAAEIRKKRLEEAGERKESSRSVLQTLGEALFGKGLAGGVATGVLAGGGLGLVIEQAVEGLAHFIEKLKEVSIEAGRLTVLQDQFDKLARGAGVNGTAMLEKMREESEGLVSKFDLLKIATTGLRSAFKISPENIEKATGAVVKLAEATGHNAQEGVNALNRALLTGNTRSLSAVTGINRYELQLRGLPPTLSQVARGQQVLNHAIERMIAASERAGNLPDTLERGIKKLEVASRDLFDSFGKGFNSSTGLQVFLSMLNLGVKDLHDMTGAAEEFGSKIGDAFGALAPIMSEFVSIVKQLGITISSVGDSFGVLFGIPIKEAPDTLDAIKKVATAVIHLGTAMQLILQSVASVIRVIASSIQFLDNLPGVKQAEKGITTYRGISLAPSGSNKLSSSELQDAAKERKDALKSMQDAFKGFGDVFQDQEKQLANLELSIADAREKAFLKNRKGAKKGSISPSGDDNEETYQSRLKAAQEQQKLEDALAKQELERKKLLIDRLKEIDNEAYALGEETLKEHLAKQAQLLKSGYDAQVREIQSEFQSKVTELNTKKQAGGFAGPGGSKSYKTELEIAAQEQNNKLLSVQAIYQKEAFALHMQDIQNDIAAEIKRAQTIAAIKSESLKNQKDLNAKQFAAGEITPAAYYAQEIALIQQRADIEIELANRVAAIKKKNNQDDAAEQDAILKARQAELNQVTSAAEGMQQKVFQQIGKFYQPQVQGYEAQLNIEQQTTLPGGSTAAQERTVENIVKTLQQQNQAQLQLFQTTKPYSDLWYQIYDNIEKTYRTQLKYQEQLVTLRSNLGPIASLLSQLGTSTSQLFGSKFAQNFAEELIRGAKQLQEAVAAYDKAKAQGNLNQFGGPANLTPLSTALDALSTAFEGKLNAATGGVIGRLAGLFKGQTSQAQLDPVQQEAQKLFEGAKSSADSIVSPFKNLQGVVQSVTEQFSALSAKIQNLLGGNNAAGGNPAEAATPGEQQSVGAGAPTVPSTSASSDSSEGSSGSSSGGGLHSFTSSIGDFTTGMVSAVKGLTGFIEGLTKAKSALSGALGGAEGGASLGLQLGGPIGAAIGATIGATLGAVFGHKNAQVTQEVNEAQTNFKQIMNQFAQNTNNIQTTIQALTQLVAQVTQEQNSSKKGHSQFQQLIDQYNQQIQQLTIQSEQVMIQMKEQLAILNAPVGAQSALSGLQSIVQQFDQFAGAAQNVKELADAYQYLNEAMQQYDQQMAEQYLQNETSAVQDALQLNDLLYQRAQYLLQINEQIQGVLQQGVLTRQMTMAQSKGEQIYQIQYGEQRQLDQMNEQISAAQYRVKAESQIFNLATTRIGLEAQLLQLQNAQTSFDMQRISALQQLVAALSGAGGQGLSWIEQLLGAIPGSTNPNGPAGAGAYGSQGITGAVTTPTGNGAAALGGTNILEALLASAYNDRANLGYGAFTGTNLQ